MGILKTKAIEFIRQEFNSPVDLVDLTVSSSLSDVKYALFARLYSDLRSQNIEAIIKVVKSLEWKSPLMKGIVVMHDKFVQENDQNGTQKVMSWFNKVFPTSLMLSSTGLAADDY